MRRGRIFSGTTPSVQVTILNGIKIMNLYDARDKNRMKIATIGFVLFFDEKNANHVWVKAGTSENIFIYPLITFKWHEIIDIIDLNL